MKTTSTLLRQFLLLLLAGLPVLAAAQCQAGFTFAVNGGTVTFTNTSTGSGTAFYSWNFGDNTYAYGSNATHTYNTAGTYNVCLQMGDSLNSSCQSTYCANVTVNVGCNNLFANIVSSTNESSCGACDGSANVTITGGTPPYSCLWSNGATTPSISSLCSGSYTLTVTDANSCTTQSILYISCPTQCQASFSAVVTGNVVTFYNTSIADSLTANFTWDFGDNTYGTGPGPFQHTYAQTGWFVVTLTVYDSLPPCYSQWNDTIYINSLQYCNASFSMMQDSLNLLQWYAYPSVAGTPPFTYLWDFGDGNQSTQQYPSHTYANPGQYIVCLTITDANSCTSTFCDSSSVQRMASSAQMQYFTAVDPATVGIPEHTGNTLRAWPNPASDQLTLTLNENVTGTVRITDLLGNVVSEQNISGRQLTIDVSRLPAGAYNVDLQTETARHNRKVVIVR